MDNEQSVTVERDVEKSNVIAGGSGNQQNISHHYYGTRLFDIFRGLKQAKYWLFGLLGVATIVVLFGLKNCQYKKMVTQTNNSGNNIIHTDDGNIIINKDSKGN